MSSHDHQALADVGKRLLEALTSEEVTLLLGALLATMPSAWHEQALQPLAEDTRLRGYRETPSNRHTTCL